MLVVGPVSRSGGWGERENRGGDPDHGRRGTISTSRPILVAGAESKHTVPSSCVCNRIGPPDSAAKAPPPYGNHAALARGGEGGKQPGPAADVSRSRLRAINAASHHSRIKTCLGPGRTGTALGDPFQPARFPQLLITPPSACPYRPS